MQKLKKRLKRYIALLLCISILSCTFVNDVMAFSDVLASASDAIQVTEIDTHGYVATGPASEIDYSGEDFPVPYIAIVDDAFVAICAVIFAACGVVASGDNLRSLAMDFYDWLSYHADQYATAWKAAVTAGTLGVGAAIKGVGSLINAAKAYFLTIKGYGTSAKTYALPAVGNVPQYYYLSPSVSAGWHDRYAYLFSYRKLLNSSGSFTVIDYFFPDTPLFAVGSNSVDLYGTMRDSKGNLIPAKIDDYHFAETVYSNGKYGETSLSFARYGSLSGEICMSCLQVPIFSTETALRYFLQTGSLMHPEDIIYNPTGISVSVRPIVDAQTKTADISDDIEVVIPSIDAIVAALSDVIDADDIADRLARTITDFAWSKVPDIVVPTDPVDPDNPDSGTADSLLPAVSLSGLVSAFVTALGFTSVVTLKSLLDSILSSLSALTGIDTIVSYLGDIKTQVADWSIDNWDQVLRAALASIHIGALDDLVGLVNTISRWNIDAWDSTLESVLARVNIKGLDSINTVLTNLGNWTFADWKDAFNLAITVPILAALATLRADIASGTSSALTALGLDGVSLGKTITDALSGLGMDIDLDKVKDMLMGLGLGALAGYLSSLLDLVGSKGLAGVLAQVVELIKALPTSIAASVAEVLPGGCGEKEDSGNLGIKNFFNLLLFLGLILIMLLILFINCLRFIVVVFNIPACTEFLNADIIRGMDFIKAVQIPGLGLSLYDLLFGAVYIVLFFSIIKALRKRIDHLKIR